MIWVDRAGDRCCLGDASASFFCETEQTGHDVWKMFPHPGLRFALSASPYGRRRARSDRSAGNVRETGEPKKQTRPRPKITYCSRKMVLTLGSTVVNAVDSCGWAGMKPYFINRA